MSTRNNTARKVNTHEDLRGYGLRGTEYRWDFKILPTYDDEYEVRVLLKPLNVSIVDLFARAPFSTEFVIDLSEEDFVHTTKSFLDRVLTIEHIKRIIGDKEM